jgi:hypothetical protein
MSEWKSPRRIEAEARARDEQLLHERREFIHAIFEEQMQLVDRGEQSREQALGVIGHFACRSELELQPQHELDGTFVRSN